MICDWRFYLFAFKSKAVCLCRWVQKRFSSTFTAVLNLPKRLKILAIRFGSGVSMRISKKLNANANRVLRPFTKNSGTDRKKK